MIDIEQLNQNVSTLKRPRYYEDWVRVRNTMFVHTRGKNPGHIVTSRRPNEDPDLHKFRLSIMPVVTTGVMGNAIDYIYQIFGAANFSIQISEELNTYLGEHKFKGHYFFSYIQTYVIRSMIEDPNGFLAWIPSGAGLTDPSVPVDVDAVLIASEAVKHLSDESLTWQADEKSWVMENGKQVEKGAVYYTLTTEGYYKHTQVGVYKDKRFELEEIYAHNIGKVPAIVLGGNLTDEGYFDSFFSSCIPWANECLRQFSDWQGVMITAGYPFREEVAETCSAPGCRDGVCYDQEEDEHRACRVCKGTGRVISRSPYGVFLREKPNSFQGGESNNYPMVNFISPPVDIVRYSGEAWQMLLKKMEEALHINTIDEAQSGTAKMYDREGRYILLSKISNNVFDEIIYNSLKFIEQYRNVTSPLDPKIVKPISFQMKTEMDLIEEINQLSDKNAPVAFLVETTKDLAKKRFSGNSSVSRMVEVLVTYDPIYHVSVKDKQMLLAGGTIKKDDMIKSMFAYKTLSALVAENGTEYLEKGLNEIFADLDAALAPVIAEYNTMQVITI